MPFRNALTLIVCCTGLAASEPVIKKEYLQTSTRTYFVESHFSGNKPPVGIMVLHGAINEKGFKTVFLRDFEASMRRLAKKYSLVAVYPMGVRGRCPMPKENFCWPLNSPADDVNFLRDIAKEVGSKYEIKRWIVIGVSNGGFYLSSLIQSGKSLPFEDAMILLGGKGWWPEMDLQWTPNLYILSGKQDEHRRHATELLLDLRKAGYDKKAKLRYADFPGGHEISWDILEEGLTEIIDRKITEKVWKVEHFDKVKKN